MIDILYSLRGFFLFFFIAAFIRLFMKKSGNKKSFEEFAQEEHEANFSRKRNIPEEIFYKPDISKFPSMEYYGQEYASINRAGEKAAEMTKFNMVRLIPPMTNSQIKKSFGVSNLSIIIQGEERYYEYIKALLNWAKEFAEIKEYAKAEAVLEICIESKPEISLPYIMLGDIFRKSGQTGKLSELNSRIANMNEIKSNTILYNKIMKHTKT